MNLNKIIGAFLLLLFTCHQAMSGGNLSKNIRIKSIGLGYELQYRVYVPEGVKPNDKLQTIYMTDGQRYIEKGKMNKILDREIAAGNIKPVIAIFVDSRNPDNLKDNRRNKQFFCNIAYANFFMQELIPHVDNLFPTSHDRKDRVILGLSFGGLNSACFGIMAHPSFQGIAMQSPAGDKHIRLASKLYATEDKKPIKIYMSVGTRNDNTSAGRLLKRTLKKKGYDLTYKEVAKGHSWDNWRPLLDDILKNFFATESSEHKGKAQN